MIDEIRYSSKWHAPSVKNEKGIALERINPDRDTQDEMNWTSASATAGYGTPGYRNSQYGKQDEGEVTGIELPFILRQRRNIRSPTILMNPAIPVELDI